MVMKKVNKLFLIVLFSLALCSCGDNVAVTIEDSKLQETVYALPEDVDYQVCVDSIDEFVDYISSGAKEKLASEGVETGDNEIFVTTDYLRSSYFLEIIPEETTKNYGETFFCYNGEGIKFVNGSFTIYKKNNQILISDAQYVSISDSLNQVIDGRIDELNGVYRLPDIFNFDFLKQSFEKVQSIQNDSEADNLEFIMKEAGLSEDMPIISLLYSKENQIDYSTPASAVDKMLPELKAYSKRTFFSSVKHGSVLADLGNGKELLINTYVMGKSSDGTPLYGIAPGGFYSEELEERKKRLYDISITDLENAEDVTYTNIFNDDIDSDYFLMAGIEGNDAKLFGLTDYEGCIIRDGDNVYPINMFIGDNPPSYFVQDDFDNDGADEYGFNTCVGRGTGYWVEALVIVDPGESDMVKIFDLDDLMIYNGDILSHIKSEVDEENCSISYWLDVDGDKEYAGTTDLSEYITDTYKPVRYGFGNLFYIEYSQDKWHFLAEGGIVWKEERKENGKEVWYERPEPDYGWTLNLTGDIQYKDGKLSYTNLELSPGQEYH